MMTMVRIMITMMMTNSELKYSISYEKNYSCSIVAHFKYGLQLKTLFSIWNNLIFKQNANAFSLIAIVEVRLCCSHEMIFWEYLGNY